jgi:hypothetical protein
MGNREDEMPMLWEWTRGARAFGEKWGKVDQAVAFIQRVDLVAYVGRNRKLENMN